MDENFLAQLFPDQYDRRIKQVLLSLFCLLTAVILAYFYRSARENPRVKQENARGLFFLSLSFLSIFLLGVAAAFWGSGPIAILLSGAVNIFLLLSIPFFSNGVTPLDKMATHSAWYFIAGQLALIYGLSILFPQKFGIDIVLSCLSLAVFGFFLSWFFIRKQLRFIGVLAGIAVAALVILQLLAEINISGGKFLDINVAVLYPALFLSMIMLVVTFNWVNEIRFKELANIYTEGVDKEMIDKFINGEISQEELTDDWEQEVTSNQLETVIEEMIMIAEKRNESLDLLLALAARNSRNNHAHYIKATIKQEDYNRERNQITVGILSLIKGFGSF